jgi:hypothetical protein
MAYAIQTGATDTGTAVSIEIEILIPYWEQQEAEKIIFPTEILSTNNIPD